MSNKNIWKYYFQGTPIHELLELMLEYPKCFNKNEKSRGGMCEWVCEMYRADIITLRQRKKLLRHIYENPTYYGKKSLFGFYFEPCQIEPRIEWIKEQIELTKLN